MFKMFKINFPPKKIFLKEKRESLRNFYLLKMKISELIHYSLNTKCGSCQGTNKVYSKGIPN